MEIVISDRLKRKGLTLEMLLNHMRLKYFFGRWHDKKPPQLTNGHLIVRDDSLDKYFMVVTQEVVSELCGFNQPSDVNVVVDLNNEVVELR